MEVVGSNTGIHRTLGCTDLTYGCLGEQFWLVQGSFSLQSVLEIISSALEFLERSLLLWLLFLWQLLVWGWRCVEDLEQVYFWASKDISPYQLILCLAGQVGYSPQLASWLWHSRWCHHAWSTLREMMVLPVRVFTEICILVPTQPCCLYYYGSVV